jgi:hypothetical protein
MHVRSKQRSRKQLCTSIDFQTKVKESFVFEMLLNDLLSKPLVASFFQEEKHWRETKKRIFARNSFVDIHHLKRRRQRWRNSNNFRACCDKIMWLRLRVESRRRSRQTLLDNRSTKRRQRDELRVILERVATRFCDCVSESNRVLARDRRYQTIVRREDDSVDELRMIFERVAIRLYDCVSESNRVVAREKRY